MRTRTAGIATLALVSALAHDASAQNGSAQDQAQIQAAGRPGRNGFGAESATFTIPIVFAIR